MVVSAVYVTNDGFFAKSFLISAITVTLCSIWPTMINTALGVASIDKDLVNVSKVLKMNTWTKITKLVLPSALPLIFTGLRLAGCRLDGSDRRRDAGAEPGSWQIRLG